MKVLHTKRRAFTLIEHIMALFIFTMSLLLLTTVVQATKKIDHYLTVSNHLEWHLFIIQLNHETSGYTVAQNSSDVLFLAEQKEAIQLKYSTEHKAGSVIYLSKNNGYHPILIGFDSTTLQVSNSGVAITVNMNERERFQLNFIPSERQLSLRVEEQHVKKHILLDKSEKEQTNGKRDE